MEPSMKDHRARKLNANPLNPNRTETNTLNTQLEMFGKHLSLHRYQIQYLNLRTGRYRSDTKCQTLWRTWTTQPENVLLSSSLTANPENNTNINNFNKCLPCVCIWWTALVNWEALWEVAGPGFRLIKYVVSDLSTPLPSTACSAASEPSASSQHDSQL